MIDFVAKYQELEARWNQSMQDYDLWKLIRMAGMGLTIGGLIQHYFFKNMTVTMLILLVGLVCFGIAMFVLNTYHAKRFEGDQKKFDREKEKVQKSIDKSMKELKESVKIEVPTVDFI